MHSPPPSKPLLSIPPLHPQSHYSAVGRCVQYTTHGQAGAHGCALHTTHDQAERRPHHEKQHESTTHHESCRQQRCREVRWACTTQPHTYGRSVPHTQIFGRAGLGPGSLELGAARGRPPACAQATASGQPRARGRPPACAPPPPQQLPAKQSNATPRCTGRVAPHDRLGFTKPPSLLAFRQAMRT